MGILENKALQDFLDSKSFDELSWMINRYCGRSDLILFEKTYGDFGVKQYNFKQEVERRLFNHLLEETLNSESGTIKE